MTEREATASGRTSATDAFIDLPPPAEVERVPQPIAMIYPSRSGGEGHIVIRGRNGVLHCTCPAASYHERDCWAISATRAVMEEDRWIV